MANKRRNIIGLYGNELMPQVRSREIPVNPLSGQSPVQMTRIDAYREGASTSFNWRILKILQVVATLFSIGSLGWYVFWAAPLWVPALCGVLALTLNRWWLYIIILFLSVTYAMLIGFYLKLVYDHFVDDPIYWVSLLLLLLIIVIGRVGYDTIREWRPLLGRW